MVSTLAKIKERLVSDSLVRRYEVGEGVGRTLKRSEGTFSMCTFWYVEALARSGQVHEARWIFEKMLGYANHVGLFAEELGPDGHQLGNYPQAFTHLGLISAAYNLDRALEGEGPQLDEEGFSLFGSTEEAPTPRSRVSRTKGLSRPTPAS
jgi:GH15 family glucan-1,4-alpha-glucosidase